QASRVGGDRAFAVAGLLGAHRRERGPELARPFGRDRGMEGGSEAWGEQRADGGLDSSLHEGSSESGLESQVDESAVFQQRRQAVLADELDAVVPGRSEVVDDLQVDAVLLVDVGAEADAVGAVALVAAERRRGV